MSENNLEFSCLQFSQLSNEQLYAILRLRAQVFIVEQDCVYQDLDACDQESWHLLGCCEGRLACYARLLPPGIKYPSASIGRVVTDDGFRGRGFGRQLMLNCLQQCRRIWPDSAITISAQQYLEDFYGGLGFVTRSEPYLEDGIPHLRMELIS